MIYYRVCKTHAFFVVILVYYRVCNTRLASALLAPPGALFFLRPQHMDTEVEGVRHQLYVNQTGLTDMQPHIYVAKKPPKQPRDFAARKRQRSFFGRA